MSNVAVRYAMTLCKHMDCHFIGRSYNLRDTSSYYACQPQRYNIEHRVAASITSQHTDCSGLLDEGGAGWRLVDSKHHVTAGVIKYEQFLCLVCWRFSAVNQRLSFLPVSRRRSLSARISLLFIILLLPRPPRSPAGLNGRLETASQLLPAYEKPGRNHSSPTTQPGVGLAPVDGRIALCLADVLYGGAVDGVIGADGAWQPLADDVSLDVVETRSGADCDEGVFQRQSLQYRLIGKQKLGHSLVKNERFVGGINDSWHVDADQQNVGCSTQSTTNITWAVTLSWLENACSHPLFGEPFWPVKYVRLMYSFRCSGVARIWCSRGTNRAAETEMTKGVDWVKNGKGIPPPRPSRD